MGYAYGYGFGHTWRGKRRTVYGGAGLLANELNGFATDFTYAVDAQRVAVKTAGVVVSQGLDSFYTNAGTSPKQVYDVAGTLGWSPHNMCFQSQTFGTTWLAPNATVISDQATAPDGTMTMDKFYPTTSGSNRWLQGSVAAGLTGTIGVTFSVYAKIAGKRWLSMLKYDGSINAAWFDLQNGVVGTVGAGYTADIKDVGNGIYRCSITSTGATVYTYFILVVVDADNVATVTANATDGLYVWGANVNRGTVPTAYIPTTTAAKFGLAIDYDPITHAARGLLCEPAATNLILNNAAMSTQSVTVTAVAYTLSFWGTGTITLSGVSTAGPLVGTSAADRVSLTFTPTAGSLTCTVTGTVSNAQLETGTVATSPIPTFAATVTRAADVYSVTNASINSSATAGSWWMETYQNTWPGSSGLRLIGFTSGGASLIRNSPTTYILFDGTSLTKTVADAYGLHKVASAYQSGDRVIAVDGLAVAVDAGATINLLTPGTAAFFGSGAGGSSSMNSYVRKVRYLPRRPTNAELVTQTT